MKKLFATAAVAALVMTQAAVAGGYSKRGATPVEPILTPPAVVQPSSAGSMGAGAAVPVLLGVLALAAIASSDDDDASSTTTTPAAQ